MYLGLLYLPFALMSAPALMSTKAVFVSPRPTALCSGVPPSSSFALISAPASMSAKAIFVSPRPTALCSRVPL